MRGVDEGDARVAKGRLGVEMGDCVRRENIRTMSQLWIKTPLILFFNRFLILEVMTDCWGLDSQSNFFTWSYDKLQIFTWSYEELRALPSYPEAEGAE